MKMKWIFILFSCFLLTIGPDSQADILNLPGTGGPEVGEAGGYPLDDFLNPEEAFLRRDRPGHGWRGDRHGRGMRWGRGDRWDRGNRWNRWDRRDRRDRWDRWDRWGRRNRWGSRFPIYFGDYGRGARCVAVKRVFGLRLQRFVGYGRTYRQACRSAIRRCEWSGPAFVGSCRIRGYY